MRSNKEIISVNIAPAKQTAKVVQGKKVLKYYRFKTVIPFTIEQKESRSYDYGEWCVSERESVSLIDVKVFCKDTINELKVKILEYYFKNEL